jgi:hypothetical protein
MQCKCCTKLLKILTLRPIRKLQRAYQVLKWLRIKPCRAWFCCTIRNTRARSGYPFYVWEADGTDAPTYENIHKLNATFKMICWSTHIWLTWHVRLRLLLSVEKWQVTKFFHFEKFNTRTITATDSRFHIVHRTPHHINWLPIALKIQKFKRI